MTILQSQLTAARATVADLERQIAEAERAKQQPVFVPKKGESFFWVSALGSQNEYGNYHNNVAGEELYGFRAAQAAEDWAFVDLVMRQMRAQPGCVAAVDGASQWALEFGEVSGLPVAGRYLPLSYKMDYGTFGIFDTEVNLNRALDAVGRDRVKKAAMILAGVVDA